MQKANARMILRGCRLHEVRFIAKCISIWITIFNYMKCGNEQLKKKWKKKKIESAEEVEHKKGGIGNFAFGNSERDKDRQEGRKGTGVRTVMIWTVTLRKCV